MSLVDEKAGKMYFKDHKVFSSVVSNLQPMHSKKLNRQLVFP